VNYIWFTPDLLVAGIVVRDFPKHTPARARMLRKTSGVEPIWSDDLMRARSVYLESNAQYLVELGARKEEAIVEYRQTKRFAEDWLTRLQPEIRQALGQVHDYRQFVSQIIQNLNVILQTKYPGSTEDALAKATHEEVAIYWAARLMEEKLVAALFLLNPERISDNQTYSQLHKAVTKYRKIYARAFESKNVRVISSGTSYGYVYGNPAALGVIPHTFIDNALKYAPSGSDVTISFSENDNSITLSVTSYGPEIRADEREKIFDPFFRGEAARVAASEGTGFGLGLAKVIATTAGLRLEVEQGSTRKPSFGFRTTFRAHYPRAYPAREVDAADEDDQDE
jgi:signal transduction histidine kinase